MADNLVHEIWLFTDAQPADRVRLETDLDGGLGALAAQPGEDAALDDPKLRLSRVDERDAIAHALAQRQHARARAPRPSQRAVDGRTGVVDRAGMRHALVEHHRDVRAELRLDVCDALGRERVQRTVEVRSEVGTLFVDRTTGGQAEHLKAAAIGKDGPLPSHEAVEASSTRDEIGTGAQVEVVGVPEHDRHTERLELGVGDGFDGRLRPDGHEGRRLDRSVRRRQQAAAREPVGLCDLEVEVRTGHNDFRVYNHDSVRMVRARRLGTMACVMSAAIWWLSPARAAAQGLSEAGRLAAVYDEILAARFDRARTLLRTACPPAPRAACLSLEAVTCWWEIVLDPNSRQHDGRLQAAAEAAVAEATTWTTREPERAEPWFYLAGAHAPLVQWRILRGQRLAAAREGSRIKSALERALERDPTLHDANFGIGLYHYYADVVPAPAKLARWLLWLPGGDRRRGMREMLDARDRGTLLSGEADFQLHWLFLWYERQPDLALARLRALTARYPSNPVFLQRIAEVQSEYLHDHPASAASWSTLLERATHGLVSAERLAETRARLGLGLALDALFETDRAVDHYAAVVRSQPAAPAGALTEAHLRLGAGYDRLGDRERAEIAYRSAVDTAAARDLSTVKARVRAMQARRPSARDAEAFRRSLEGLRALERADVAAALSALDRATILTPRDGVALHRHARALVASGDRARARARLEAVLDPMFDVPSFVRASAHVDYAEILERAADHPRALEHYRHALAIVGGTRDARDRASAALARLTK